MDRTEAALLVAEAALGEVRQLQSTIAEMQRALASAFSFVVNEAGDLMAPDASGQLRSIGHVRGRDGIDAPKIKRISLGDGNALTVELDDGAEMKAGTIKVKDGADGLGFDDLEVLHDGERQIMLRFVGKNRAVEKTFTFPVQIYRGVYVDGKAYARGDTVTWAGSLWHCDDDTTEKPGEGSKAWRLAVKRGRDGKEPVNLR